MVRLAWYFYKRNKTIITTIMQKNDINIGLHHDVKIGKRGGQVTMTVKTTTFCQVWHTYAIIHVITDKIICVKIV